MFLQRSRFLQTLTLHCGSVCKRSFDGRSGGRAWPQPGERVEQDPPYRGRAMAEPALLACRGARCFRAHARPWWAFIRLRPERRPLEVGPADGFVVRSALKSFACRRDKLQKSPSYDLRFKHIETTYPPPKEHCRLQRVKRTV